MFCKRLKGRSIVENTGNTVLCYLQQNTTDPQILFTVTMHQNFQYHIKAFNHQYINLPKQFIIDDATALIDLLTYKTSLKIFLFGIILSLISNSFFTMLLNLDICLIELF